MLYLKLTHEIITQAEMRQIAVKFYKELYHVDVTDQQCREVLLKHLLNLKKKKKLDLGLKLQELTSAVTAAIHGQASGITGVPTKFYKHLWEKLESFMDNGKLPTRPFLFFFKKKGYLVVLHTLRLVSLLCRDQKI